MIDCHRMYAGPVTSSLPRLRGRLCYIKISKIQEFVRLIFESKAQQELVVRAKKRKVRLGQPDLSIFTGIKMREKEEYRIFSIKRRTRINAGFI